MNAARDEDDDALVPKRSFGIRFGIFAALCAFALIGNAAPVKTAGFCVSMAFLIGTFPLARRVVDRFERRWHIAFVPMRPKRWPLDRFIRIEIGNDEEQGSHGLWLFFTRWLALRWLADAATPWLGGSYRIHLRSKSGKKVLAWNGDREADFRSNLDRIQRWTGLRVEQR